MIDLNEFYARYNANQEGTKRKLVQQAVDELLEATEENYYDTSDLKYANG